MRRTTWLGVFCMLLSSPAFAQTRALNSYLDSETARAEAAAAAQTPAGSRDAMALRNLLPHRRASSFVTFVNATQLNSLDALLNSVDSLRLNKMVANAPGTGGTSLVSRVAVPAVLGAAVEYGSILQQTNGTVTTFRGNALGIARMLFGGEQFPYCPELESGSCGTATRRLRSVSSVVAFEHARSTTASVAAPTPSPMTASALGDEFRVISWGLRFDLTPSNNLDDAKYVNAWTGAIQKLRNDPTGAKLTEAVVTFFNNALANDMYTAWMSETVTALTDAATESEFYEGLESRLRLLAMRMAETDADFSRNLYALDRAYSNYYTVRDSLLREIQVHKLSLEYTNHHGQEQPHTSNMRLIYSHQPTIAPTLVTLNAALSWYNEVPTSINASRLRDFQFAGQLDRRLSQIPHFGYAVASFGVYYQWMKNDALVQIGSGNVTPGLGAGPAGAAGILSGTKGHIGVVQGRLSIPVSDVVKVPLSVTWASRKELIKEEDVRGQIGLTLDLDQLFH